MGDVTEINWTSTVLPDGRVEPGATFNPWIGCQRVSPGCVHCYAEAMAKRYGWAEWGPTGTRVKTSDAYWQKPITWNRQAIAKGYRRKVFCGSLCDVFEDRPELDLWREQLWRLIENTPGLFWLLLTKRPENVADMVWESWLIRDGRDWPNNVWLGTTVENQAAADKRIPILLRIPAPVRFLSCEPLLGPVVLQGDGEANDPGALVSRAYLRGVAGDRRVDWVIAGGESGAQARPMHPDWVRSLRDQTVAAGVPYLVKQWGEWLPEDQIDKDDDLQWPQFSRVHFGALGNDGQWRDGQFTKLYPFPGLQCMYRVGKKAAGRLLDGEDWFQFPSYDPKMPREVVIVNDCTVCGHPTPGPGDICPQCYEYLAAKVQHGD